MGHRIRVGQLGWVRDRAATTVEEVEGGIGCSWVEIDGHRFDGVVAVDYRADENEITVPVVTVEVIGAVEIVYVDDDGEPLPGPRGGQVAGLGDRFDCETARPINAA